MKLLKPASRTAWLKEIDWGLAAVLVLVLVDLELDDIFSVVVVVLKEDELKLAEKFLVSYW